MQDSAPLHHQARQAQADLENRIIKGIAAEWQHAVSEADSYEGRISERLKRPTFLLHDMELLGTWDRRTATIAIQRRFALEHPWEAVVDVVKHETAHQIADQLMKASAEAMPHGPEFRAACRLLHISPRASGDYKTLYDCMQEGVEGESDRLLVKIRKLLALAEGGEPHEAEAALSKAQSLIAHYHLDLLEVKRAREFFSIILGEPAIRRDQVECMLGGLLRDFYFVEVIWTTMWVVSAERFGRALELSGTSENLKLAEYVYHFIRRFIDSAWESFRQHRRLGTRAKRDFGLGLIAAFHERLEAERNALQHERSDSRALMMWRDPELHAYYRFRHPRVRNSGSSRQTLHLESYEAGRAEGSRLEIRGGLDGAGAGPRLLPARASTGTP